MSPVLAAALARAEAADALPFDADFASGFAADAAAPPHRASRTPGRSFGSSGWFGHSARRGEGRRS